MDIILQIQYKANEVKDLRNYALIKSRHKVIILGSAFIVSKKIMHNVMRHMLINERI